MSEEIKEVKEIEMYMYIANGKELWTSNLTFAQIRANHYGTYKVYFETFNVEN
jgi:hypothetical protein